MTVRIAVGKHAPSEILHRVGKTETAEPRVGGVCRLPAPPDWPPAAVVSPGCSSVLQLLRFLKCHLCLMAALISCIRKKHTPVVSGYIWSQGSVPRRTHTRTHTLCRSHPSQACSLAVGRRRANDAKKGEGNKISSSNKKIKTANGLIIWRRSRAARTASRRVLTRPLYRGELI